MKSSYVTCPECFTLIETTGKRHVECSCGWSYTKVLNTRHPKFERDDYKEKIQVGYGS